jgi:hypothetical protein
MNTASADRIVASVGRTYRRGIMNDFITVRVDATPFVRRMIDALREIERLAPPEFTLDPMAWADIEIERADADQLTRNLLCVRPLPCSNR